MQRTADRQVVLSHDAHLRDADGRYWPVGRSTLAEPRSIDLGEGERIPTFAEAVDTCRSEQLGAYIELKDSGAIPGVLTTLREKGFAGHCIIGSFRPDWLAEVKAAMPQVATSVLFSVLSVDPVKLAQAVGANYVHPCWERYPNPSSLLTPEWMTPCCAGPIWGSSAGMRSGRRRSPGWPAWAWTASAGCAGAVGSASEIEPRSRYTEARRPSA